MARHTRSEVAGMSISTVPSGANASTTAFMIAAGAPMVPASPQPLAPHHPISSWLYYEQQKPEAKRRAKDFWRHRVPKFLGYFERVLRKNGGPYLIGGRLTYVDLSIFQNIEGLRHAFPRHMKRFERKIPGLVALHDRMAQRPRIKAYLAS